MTNAAAAQTTATTALAVATDASTKAVSVEQQAEALAAADGQVNTPSYYLAGNPLIVGFYCSTSGAAIHYRVNGGAWSLYSSTVTITAGDHIEAYATKAATTDSGIVRYDA